MLPWLYPRVLNYGTQIKSLPVCNKTSSILPVHSITTYHSDIQHSLTQRSTPTMQHGSPEPHIALITGTPGSTNAIQHGSPTPGQGADRVAKKIHNKELKRKKCGDNKIDRRLVEARRGQEGVTHEGKCLKSPFFLFIFSFSLQRSRVCSR